MRRLGRIGPDRVPWLLVPADPDIPTATGTAGPREFVAIVVALMMTMSFAIDLMLPAFPDMRRAFGMAADSTEVTWTVTAYFYGLAIGPWLYGPASDRFGRRRPLYAGLTLCIVAAALSALVPTWHMVVIGRFLWGLGAGAPRTLAPALIRDRYDGNTMARLMSLILAVFMLAPIAAPMLGSALLAFFPWQSVFWFPVLMAVVTMVWLRRLPETLPPERRRPLSPRSILSAIGEILRCRQTVALTMTMMLTTGIITAFIASSQVIIDDTFGLGGWFSPLFAAMATVMGLNALLTARRVQASGAEAIARRNSLAAICASACLLLVAHLADGYPPFWLFLASWVIAIALSQSVNPTSNALAMAPLPHIAGTTSSVIATVTAAGGALIGGVAANSFDGTARPYAAFFFAYTVLAASGVFFGLRGRISTATRPDDR